VPTGYSGSDGLHAGEEKRMTEPAAKVPFSLEDGNWIPVFRQIRKHWTWADKPFARGQALVDILIRANWHESTMPFRGTNLPIRPREVACTYESLGESWGWSRGKVRRFIDSIIQDGTVNATWIMADPETGSRVDRKTDSSILVLTVIRMPLNGPSHLAKAGERTGDPTGNGQETDRKRTHPRHIRLEEHKTKTETGSPEARALAQSVVDIWNEDRPQAKHIRVTAKRVSHVNARLADGFTPDQIMSIARKLKASAWHQGKNDRGWKAPGPEWAFDSTEKAEQWADKEIESTKPRTGYVPRI
jgi:hypothetical protein